MRLLFAAAPAYGLMLPIVPLVWAARAAGHEVLLVTASGMVEVAAQAGLPVVDAVPDRELWGGLTSLIGNPAAVPVDAPEELRLAAAQRAPFAMFTVLMTEPTIAAARAFEPDVIVTTSDHPVGALGGRALGVPVLEVGNRVSWSTRDASWRNTGNPFALEAIVGPLRERVGISDGPPELIARIDPRPPSMGGLTTDEPDRTDGVPWWPMAYVPFNGGGVLPDWAQRSPERPIVGVTLGTVVPSVVGTSSLAVVLDGLAELDVDVVLAAGQADLSALGELPANVRSVGYLPLSIFLPVCSVLVHHGGSGTTAAPLFYGVPQLVLPSFADNPLSAQRVVDRGVGLSLDPKTARQGEVRDLVRRLLEEPAFAEAAADVRAEMAGQPSPASIIERVAAHSSS